MCVCVNVYIYIYYTIYIYYMCIHMTYINPLSGGDMDFCKTDIEEFGLRGQDATCVRLRLPHKTV